MTEALVVVLSLTMVGERLVEVIKPVFRPLIDWLTRILKCEDDYIEMLFSIVVVGLVAAASGVNLFSDTIPNEVIGRIITAVACAGGSNVLHDLWPSK